MTSAAGYVQQASVNKLNAHAKKIADDNTRPFLYQRKVVRNKDELVRNIAKKDGVTEGLICVMSTLELAKSFSLRNGWIAPASRKCLHFYFYFIHRELGFMHGQDALLLAAARLRGLAWGARLPQRTPDGPVDPGISHGRLDAEQAIALRQILKGPVEPGARSAVRREPLGPEDDHSPTSVASGASRT